MRTRLQEVWDRGEAVNGWLTIPSTITAETVARQDYDSIVVDLQHGLIDYQMALPMIQAIGAASDATRDRAPALERAGHHHEAAGCRRLGHSLPDDQQSGRRRGPDARLPLRAARPAQRRSDPGDDGLRPVLHPGRQSPRHHARHDRDARGARQRRGDRADAGPQRPVHRPERSRPVARLSDPAGSHRRRHDGGDRAHPRGRQSRRDQGRDALHDAGLRGPWSPRASTS